VVVDGALGWGGRLFIRSGISAIGTQAQTTAVKKGNDWVLNGSCGSGARGTQTGFFVMARTRWVLAFSCRTVVGVVEGLGELGMLFRSSINSAVLTSSKTERTGKAFTGFIVDGDTPGITLGRKEKNIGQRCVGFASRISYHLGLCMSQSVNCHLLSVVCVVVRFYSLS